MMAGRASGAAVRRRERRLRSAWRHEQLSVAMALAAAAHHSAQPNAALRGQKTGTRASEGEACEPYDALRGQKRPPPGMRPGVLVDPALQLGCERAGCPRSLVPPLELPRLAADVSLDSAALAFLVSASLEQQVEMVVEQEEEEEEEEPEELYSQRASLQHHHSGVWSSLGMGTAKLLQSWGSIDESLVRFTFLDDQGEVLVDLPVVRDHPRHWVLRRVHDKKWRWTVSISGVVDHFAITHADDGLAMEFADNLYCAKSLLDPA